MFRSEEQRQVGSESLTWSSAELVLVDEGVYCACVWVCARVYVCVCVSSAVESFIGSERERNRCYQADSLVVVLEKASFLSDSCFSQIYPFVGAE